ncbi:hypothetical protein, partial [Enterobacter intestinihominis]
MRFIAVLVAVFYFAPQIYLFCEFGTLFLHLTLFYYVVNKPLFKKPLKPGDYYPKILNTNKRVYLL